jgi:hypothetical protein
VGRPLCLSRRNKKRNPNKQINTNCAARTKKTPNLNNPLKKLFVFYTITINCAFAIGILTIWFMVTIDHYFLYGFKELYHGVEMKVCLAINKN